MFNNYKAAISSQRLESFRKAGDDDIETLSKYLWNISLCESFYPSLESLEVGLRNAIHNALTFCYRTPLWFKQPFMCSMCAEDILDAEDKLIEKGKNPTNAGRVIAELKFGFWARLFNKHYQQALWNNKTFTLRVFPKATAQERIRSDLSVRVDTVRRFRNRVFHYEPIISHQITDIHKEIIEMLGWINPVLVKAHSLVDRFPEVTTEEYYNSIKQKVSAEV